MAADVARWQPFHEHFRVEELHVVDNRVAADTHEQQHIQEGRTTDERFGYNVMIGMPLQDRRFWAMQYSRGRL